MLDLFVYGYAAIMAGAIVSGLYWTASLYLEERKK
jgi:hypothetical protein